MAERYRMTSQIKFNVRSYLERLFVNEGLYTVVNKGDLDLHNNDLSLLRRVDSKTYEGISDRWVYETDASGIAPYNTTVCSGVYINGVWQAKGSGAYVPSIDYNRGRVIFANAVPANSGVQAPHTFKHVIIEWPESNLVKWLFSEGKSNVDYTPHAYPSGNKRVLPLVIIDLQKRLDRPWAIGGTRNFRQSIVFHVLANNQPDLDLINDILTDPDHIKGVDSNKIPVLFNYKGDKAATYQSFAQLQGNLSYAWANLYIDEATLVKQDRFGALHRSRVDWVVTIYK